MLFKLFKPPIYLAAAIVLVFIFEVLVPGDLSWLGIRPRSIFGLLGVPFSPFLHADIWHLIANIVPLLLMGIMLSALDDRRFLLRTVLMILGSGLLTWLIGSSALIIGASGLVFAYLAYLIVNGIRTRKVKDIAIAALTIFVYGTLLFSLFRAAPGISWAGHFSGAIVGGLLAWRETDLKS